MALNFPNPATQTPVNTFSPTSTPSASTNGITYLWDGQKWNAQTNGDAAFWQRVGTTLSPATVGDNISTTGDLTTADATVDTLTSNGLVDAPVGTFAGDVQVGSLNSGPLAGFRNLLINGDFRIWERGTSVDPIATGEYGPDRWLTTGATTGSSRMQRSGNATTDSNGVSGMLDANELSNVTQLIELSRPGYNSQFPIGSQWTVSFYTDQNIAGNTVPNVRFRKLSNDAGFSGTYVTAADVSTTTWQGGAFPDKGTLKHYWFTFTISGDASTIASGTAESLAIAFPSDSSGLTKMTYCQLEPGPVPTPFEHRPIGTELALCQRYYKNIGTVFFSASAISTPLNSCQGMIVFGVPMRAAPSATLTGQNVSNTVGTNATPESIRLNAQASSASGTARANDVRLDAEL